LVVRQTNTNVICQIVSSKIQGDVVLCAAYSHELPRYGVKVGLTNYAAAYCTGLLCARRVLVKLGLDKTEFNVENGPRSFKAVLDTGLGRTSTGAKLFGVMKGAVDGGLNIPHSEKRLPGYNKEKDAVDGEVLRKYIFGGNVADYMRQLKEDDEEAYKKHFSRFIAAGVTADKMESIYTSAHSAIRADPSQSAKKERTAADQRASKKFRKTPMNLKQRKDRVRQKIAAFARTNGIDV
jgi:large subunit ribosomal protein L5e